MYHTKEKTNIILFMIGSSMSQFGTVIYTFAIGLYVLDLTGSGLKFATTLVIGFLPTILIHPFAGVIADKIDKKIIVVLADIMCGLLYFLLFYYLQLKSLNLSAIYIVTLMTNIFNSFFAVAIDSAKPHLVRSEKLQRLNSISQIITAGTRIIGPMFGGLVYSYVDIKLFVLINGISFLLSGISECFIDFKLNLKSEFKEKIVANNILKELKEGFIYVIYQKQIMKYYVLFVILNIGLSLGILVPLPYILNNSLAIRPEGIGIVNGMMPVGMIIGALLVDQITKKVKWDKLLIPLALIATMIIVFIGLPGILSFIVNSKLSIVIYYSILMGVLGCILSLIDIPIMTHIQTTIEEQYLGRVLGILVPMIKIVNPISYIISGVLLNKVNPFYIPIGVGVFLCFIFMGGFTVKKLWGKLFTQITD